MAVPEQLPIVSYVANGATDHFNITFDLSDERFLVVTVNNEIPQVGAFTVQDKDVVFSVKPEAGTIITLARDTDLERETTYSRYDNSFNPAALNWDLDKLWHVLQEQNLVDAKILARIKSEIEWRRTHDFNYDELAQVREKQQFDALKSYSEALLASANPGVFQGVIAGVVFARDGKSIQTHLEEILESLVQERESIKLKAAKTYVDEQLLNKQEQIDSKAPLAVTDTLQQQKVDKTYFDTTLSSFQNGAVKAYPTLATANADITNIALNTKVSVLSATEGGDYYKASADATSLTKSAYDPVTQAKTYADTTKLDLSNIQYKYINGNMIGPKTKTVEGKGLNSASAYITGATYASKIIPVSSNDNIFLLNETQNYAAGSGYGYAFFDKDPSADGTAVRIAHTASSATDPTTSLIYNHVYTPTGAKFLVLNSKFTNPIVWAVHKDNFSSSYTPGTEVVTGLNGAEIEKQLSNSIAKELNSGNVQIGEIFTSDGILQDKYINSQGALANATVANNWKVFRLKVNAGEDYFLKIIGPTTFPFKMNFSSSFDTVGTGTNLGAVSIQLTDQDNVYKFTAVDGAVAVFMNVKVDTRGYTLNLMDTLSIQNGKFDEAYIGKTERGISSINNIQIVDKEARKELRNLNPENVKKTRFSGKKVIALGDSITAGTQGGYIKYLEAAFDTIILNHGSSGGRSSRVFDQVVAGEGLPRRNSSQINWPVIDFTNTACVTLMIGTNDSDGSSFGAVTDIPTTNFSDFTTLAEYAALFPNNYLANIAFVIEYIKNKAPKAEIHIITPPYRYDTTNGTQRITKLIPALEAISRYYGVHLIYATYECGIGFKEMNGALNIYSYDGIHFNEQGNEVFGKFVAQKVLSFG